MVRQEPIIKEPLQRACRRHAALWNAGLRFQIAQSSESLRCRWHVRHVEQSQFLLEGEKYRKGSPAFSGSPAAGEMNRPLMLFDDAAAHPKAQACALFTFGGEEGSEKILADSGGDACAGVEYGNAHSPARRIGGETGFAQMQNQLAPVGHRVEGIADEVGEYLPQFAGKSSHRRRRFEALLDVDVGLADLRRKQNQHALQHVSKIHLHRRLRFAVEGQELSRDLRDAGQFLTGKLQVLTESCCLACARGAAGR